MINLDLNGVKNAFFPSYLINISININRQKEVNKEPITELNAVEVKKKYYDNKTTLGGWALNEINKFNEDITVYIFIQKQKTFSAWNLVAPFFIGLESKKTIQFGLGYFALEGSGGGLSKTEMLMFHLNKHKQKGYNVNMLPMVIESELLENFEYVDSGVTLSNLLENAIPLINYRKDSFEWIYKQYNELVDEYELE
jgi:hypothetical protein